MEANLTPASFYKKPLPSSCIPFISSKGKEFFGNALNENNMDSYFPLASQFVTQNEPAFCALGTLCMILNALEKDPSLIWKGVWRFYEQEMLDCCRPLSDVKEVGLTLPEFACLARCNGLNARIVSPILLNSTSTLEDDLEMFRKDLRLVSKGEGKWLMALSYSRKSLGQTGDGHFSPVGGFSEKDDSILILDVARFKYPSYWISVTDAWNSLLPLDKATGQPRGYAILSIAPEKSGLLSGSELSEVKLTLNKSSWSALSNQISKVLLSIPTHSTGISVLLLLSQVLDTLPLRPLVGRTSSTASITVFSPGTGLNSPILSDCLASIDSLTQIFMLALFNGSKNSFLELLPIRSKEEVRTWLDLSVTRARREVIQEIEALTFQLNAMGECCKQERKEGVACNC